MDYPRWMGRYWRYSIPAVLKEINEETGLEGGVSCVYWQYMIKAVIHIRPEPFYIYKLVFLCDVKEGTLNHGFDMKGASYYSLKDLPELSEDRILKNQLIHLFGLVKSNNNEVYVD